jgi:hypothetical protein
MANWVITATTIYCDAIDDEVTLIVSSDGTSRCTGYQKYGKPGREITRLMKIKGRRLGRKLGCEGSGCYRVTQYRDKLFAEEAGAGEQADSE